MSVIETIACEEWRDFKDGVFAVLYPDGVFSRDRFWFRGQSSAEHGLESSFDRWYKTLTTPRTRQEIEKSVLDQFKEEAQWYQEFAQVEASKSETCTHALARHYGVPTRLLDWSESPYVAAFFAFSGVPSLDPGIPVAIWALPLESTAWKEDVGVRCERVSALGNRRLKEQLGCFTLLRSPVDSLNEHAELFAKTHKLAKCPFLYKFELSASLARQALLDLDCMGINHASLYGGLEGCAAASKMRVALSI